MCFENITASTIYEVPLLLNEQGLVAQVLKLSLEDNEIPNLDNWIAMVKKIKNANQKVSIALVGKYVELRCLFIS